MSARSGPWCLASPVILSGNILPTSLAAILLQDLCTCTFCLEHHLLALHACLVSPHLLSFSSSATHSESTSITTLFPLESHSLTLFCHITLKIFILCLFGCARSSVSVEVFDLRYAGSSLTKDRLILNPLPWERRFLATGPPGKPLISFYIMADLQYCVTFKYTAK